MGHGRPAVRKCLRTLPPRERTRGTFPPPSKGGNFCFAWQRPVQYIVSMEETAATRPNRWTVVAIGAVVGGPLLSLAATLSFPLAGLYDEIDLEARASHLL